MVQAAATAITRAARRRQAARSRREGPVATEIAISSATPGAAGASSQLASSGNSQLASLGSDASLFGSSQLASLGSDASLFGSQLASFGSLPGQQRRGGGGDSGRVGDGGGVATSDQVATLERVQAAMRGKRARVLLVHQQVAI